MRRRRRLVDIVTREGSSLIFSAALLYMLWIMPPLTLDTPEKAMWYVFGIAVVCLFYVLLQAISAVQLPLGRETGPLTDLLVSLLPLFVLGYTLIDWVRQGTQPQTATIILVILTAVATFIDVIVFTWFSLRLNRLAPEIVPIE
jgi:hypothetical protein